MAYYAYPVNPSLIPSLTPSYSTVWITASTTVTSYITSTKSSGAPEPTKAIIDAIEGLDDCSQPIVFESLANSYCNPADFLCICNELVKQGVADKIYSKCKSSVANQYMKFEGDVCHNVRPVLPPVTPSTIIVTPTPAPYVVNSGYSNFTKPAVSSEGDITVDVKITTTETIKITTTNAAGSPIVVQSIVSSVVPSVAPPPGYATPSGPPTPQYTGAATSMKMGAFAGAVGFLAVVFAGL